MLRHTNSTRSSIRSVPLEHIDSQVASRDAHVAATHAFNRARERTSNSYDNMFPVALRSLDSDSTAVTTPVSSQSRQSVRFVGQTGVVRTRQSTVRTSGSADVGTPSSVDTLKPGATYGAAPTNVTNLQPTVDIVSRFDTGQPPRNYLVASSTNVNSEESEIPPPTYHIRRSKSLFTQSDQASCGEQPLKGLLLKSNGSGANVQDSDATVHKPSGHQSLRAPKSTGMLAGFGDQLVMSHCEQVRELAVRLAKDKWNSGDIESHNADGKKHNAMPALFFRASGIKKSLRREEASNPPTLPFSLSHHSPAGSREASLRHRARKASHSLRNKLRNLFKINNVGPEDAEPPGHNFDSPKSDGINSTNTPAGNEAKLRYHNTGSVSRVTSGMASLVDVPAHQAMRSRQGSINELDDHRVSTDDDKSRATSWTSSAATASSTGSASTWADWDKHKQRLPSSSVGSPGLIVDSQRVYSALMKRLDETRQLVPIEEHKDRESSPLTIHPISTQAEEEDNVFTSPPLAGILGSRAQSPALSAQPLPNDDDGCCREIAPVNPTSHIDNLPQPPRVIANRQSAFFGSPTCHLFRTKSPYRRALQKSMKEEEEALKSNAQMPPKTGRPPMSLRIEVPPKNVEGVHCVNSPSVYSCDSPLQDSASVDGEDGKEQSIRDHGEAKIYLNPPTYCPAIQRKGRIVSNASSVEWKTWLSSHVSKLEHESPTRSSPNLGTNIYSPAMMSPSLISPTGNLVDCAESGRKGVTSRKTPTPKPLRLRISSRGDFGLLSSSSGNMPCSGETAPKRCTPSPRVNMSALAQSSNDSNDRQSPTPPIPARSSLRKASSVSNMPRHMSRALTPSRVDQMMESSEGSVASARTRPFHSRCSTSGFDLDISISGERRISRRFARQPDRACLSNLSCASTPGFPVNTDGQVPMEKHRDENRRPISEDGICNADEADPFNATPIRGMTFMNGAGRDMVETFLSERRRRMVSSGEESAFI